MYVKPSLRQRRFRKDPEVYGALSGTTPMSMTLSTSLQPPSGARMSLAVRRNALKRALKKRLRGIRQENILENSFITQAQTRFKQENMYKRLKEKGYARPGDSAHKASLKQRVDRMTPYKRKMFNKNYDDYDPTNRHRMINPTTKSYAKRHAKEYDSYSTHRMYNG